jgi:hypothetical protein
MVSSTDRLEFIAEEISDLEYVVEVTGEYTDGITGRGASHEHINMNDYF